ncbi:TPA: hypothetical protein R8F97_003483 [Pseudomonas putida]|nr:hypothetical protein [Pseudomonas putida]
MTNHRPPQLDAHKLFENALTSMRLGIEDFELSQKRGVNGDPARALSAVRNLFAGVLLLFKYKITTCVDNPDDAAQLIFVPPEILPHGDGLGGVEWLPSGKFKASTIDVVTIAKRFTSFGIEVDWDVIRKLQECRNHLEHLHPANTLGEVADFVAELFPVLRDFIQNEMEMSPVDLLGPAWESMLDHHRFVKTLADQCRTGWAQSGLPERMELWLEESGCEECGSSLLAPEKDSLKAGWKVESHPNRFQYICLACSYSAPVAELMLETMAGAHYYDPRDGGDRTLEVCNECGIEAFFTQQQSCQWCEAKLEFTECAICESALGQDDQDNGAICSYHAYVADQDERD